MSTRQPTPPTPQDEHTKFHALIDGATLTWVESSSGSVTSSSRQDQLMFGADGRWWRHYESIMISPAGNVTSVEDNSGTWSLNRIDRDETGSARCSTSQSTPAGQEGCRTVGSWSVS